MLLTQPGSQGTTGFCESEGRPGMPGAEGPAGVPSAAGSATDEAFRVRGAGWASTKPALARQTANEPRNPFRMGTPVESRITVIRSALPPTFPEDPHLQDVAIVRLSCESY